MFNANFGWLNLDVNCQWTDSEDSAQEIFESYPVQKSMGKLLFVYLGGNSGRSGSGATLQHHVAVLWICWGLKKILSHMVNLGRNQSVWWFQIFFIFNPIWGKWSDLTNIFQMGWNHHLAVCFLFLSPFLQANPCEIHLAVAAAQCQGSLTRGKNCHPLSMELPKWTLGISLDKCHQMPKSLWFFAISTPKIQNLSMSPWFVSLSQIIGIFCRDSAVFDQVLLAMYLLRAFFGWAFCSAMVATTLGPIHCGRQ